MPELNVIVRKADQTTKAEISINEDSVVSDIIEAAVNNWALPTDTDYSVVNITTGKTLIPSKTLKQNDVQNDNILEVQTALVAGV